MRILALLCVFASTAALAGETTCSVMLTDTGDQKINVIKLVREYTSLGLKDAKDLVEAPKPRLIKEGMSRTDADALVAKLVASGAKAEVHQRGEPASHPRGAPPEASAFDVKLESWGTNKIQVIKIVRENTQLGLKEVKELVEAAPIIVRKGQTRAQAEKMIKDLTAAGATATVLPSP